VTPDGRPLAGAVVVASGPEGPIATIVAEGAGRARLQTPLGEWTVGGASLDGYVGERSLAAVRGDGVLTLQPTTSTLVEVSQPDGTPATQMLVTVTRGEDVLGQALTNNQGTYTFLGLPAGAATVEIHGPFGRHDMPDVELSAVVATGDPDDHFVSHRIGSTPPSFTASAPPSGVVGTAYDYVFAASGEPAPTFELAAGTLPPGLTLAPSGRLAGVPTTAGDMLAVAAISPGGRVTTGDLVVRIGAAPAPPVPTPTTEPTPSTPPSTTSPTPLPVTALVVTTQPDVPRLALSLLYFGGRQYWDESGRLLLHRRLDRPQAAIRRAVAAVPAGRWRCNRKGS
jgi:hypothetical protein